MKIKNKLFWEKYRPNTIEPEKGKIPIILLPRIKRIVDKGIQMNYMFYGGPGLGKTSIAGILCQDVNELMINCSNDRGIDVLREDIFDHVKNYSVLGKKGIKVVWLEEFDNATPDMRKALRGFIEKYSDHVRFIATVNNITKLQRSDEDKALLSRFNLINFDPIDQEENDFLRKKQLLYLKSISNNIKLDISDEVLSNILYKNFPNLRNSVQTIQEISVSGDLESYEKMKTTHNNGVYSYIMDGKIDLSDIYYYVCDNYPREKTEDLLMLLSRQFFKFLMDEYPDDILKIGQKMIMLSKEYNSQYVQTTDPEIHLINYVLKLKELFVK